jgi:hypothetical protein
MRPIFSVAGLALLISAASAPAGTITTSSSAPTGATIAQPDFSGAAFDPAKDFTDNAGPPGQTFSFAPPIDPPLPGPFFITAVTVKGFANTSASFGGNVNTGTWTLTLSRVDAGNVLTRIAQETANPAAVTDGSAYVTFALDTPVPLALGTTQAFDIFSSTGYFGFAKSTTDVFAAGAAMQHGSTSRTSADGAAITNIQGVDRTFFITVATPEPGSFVMLSVIGLAAFTRRRRR